MCFGSSSAAKAQVQMAQIQLIQSIKASKRQRKEAQRQKKESKRQRRQADMARSEQDRELRADRKDSYRDRRRSSGGAMTDRTYAPALSGGIGPRSFFQGA